LRRREIVRAGSVRCSSSEKRRLDWPGAHTSRSHRRREVLDRRRARGTLGPCVTARRRRTVDGTVIPRDARGHDEDESGGRGRHGCPRAISATRDSRRCGNDTPKQTPRCNRVSCLRRHLLAAKSPHCTFPCYKEPTAGLSTALLKSRTLGHCKKGKTNALCIVNCKTNRQKN